MKVTGKLVEIGDDLVIEVEKGGYIDIRGLTHEQIRSVASNFMTNVVISIDSAEVTA